MYMPSRLLQVDTNAKTVKGRKMGFMTGILYLAPGTLSGYQVCPMAETAGCLNACLNTAGRGAMNAVQAARVNKTLQFFENQHAFMAKLADDIRKLVNRAAKAGLTPLVRLNGTSDIRWENIPVTLGDRVYPNIMAVYPEVQFYDYTKLSNRKDIPANYDLTYSYSSRVGYQIHVMRAIKAGMRIAVVFRSRSDIPETFLGMQCVDGDDSDIRHLDPQGVVVALYAKGKAKQDDSGFVVDTAYRVFPILTA